MIRAVLFDRDGTLIADEPGKQGGIAPMPGAARALQRLRAKGFRIGVITNQPAIARGEIDAAAFGEVNAGIENAVGKIDGWFVCAHSSASGCECRKPQAGLIHAACRQFGVLPGECVVVGDIGSDVEAAQRAGAQAILVPTPVTRNEEVASAPVVCANLNDAVDRILEAVPVR